MNSTGSYDTFVGYDTANGLTVGSKNIFLGFAAGNNNGGGDNDIYIGNLGCPGPAPCSESNTIRIGGVGSVGSYGPQTAAYIVGIYNSTATPTPPFQAVCVDLNGTLFGTTPGTNCVTSSRRFKDHIADMGDSSSKLFQLRPVTFFYKPQYDDGSHHLQYGLVAEEVAQVYPEMVAYDKDGKPFTVLYQMLVPMLLGEFQKEHAVVMTQQHELQTQLQRIKAQRQEIDGLKLQQQQQNALLQERLSKLESYVATQMKTASDNPSRATPAANGGLQ